MKKPMYYIRAIVKAGRTFKNRRTDLAVPITDAQAIRIFKEWDDGKFVTAFLHNPEGECIAEKRNSPLP